MVNEITADLNDVKTALTTFVNDAHGQYQAQTSSLSSALSKLKTSVSDLAAHPGVSTVSTWWPPLARVNTAGQNLLAAVNTSCLSASPIQHVGLQPRLAGASARLHTIHGAWRGYRSGRDHVCLRVGRLARFALPAWRPARSC